MKWKTLLLLICFFSSIIIIIFFSVRFSKKRFSLFSWNFQNVVSTKFVRNWSIIFLIVTSTTEILKILNFCLGLFFPKKSERFNFQVLRDGRKTPSAVSLAYSNVRWHLNFSLFFYLKFCMLLFHRDAFKTFEYEICLKFDPCILEISGFKVLKRESA